MHTINQHMLTDRAHMHRGQESSSRNGVLMSAKHLSDLHRFPIFSTPLLPCPASVGTSHTADGQDTTPHHSHKAVTSPHSMLTSLICINTHPEHRASWVSSHMHIHPYLLHPIHSTASPHPSNCRISAASP